LGSVTNQQLSLLTDGGLAACWGVLALTWLVAAIYYESSSPAELERRPWVSIPVGLVAIFALSLAVPKADWNRLTLNSPPVQVAGLVILVAATALAVWARISLGIMWTAAPAVKVGHRLRTTGPYRLTRHPIYTGLLGMMLGSLLLAGAGRWILPFPIFAVLLEFKIRSEERLMLAQFPDEYPSYRERVPQLVPGLRLPRRRGAGSRQEA
jgi:protein-S-isoprenylcysteine O-methyltransferase Ste14